MLFFLFSGLSAAVDVVLMLTLLEQINTEKNLDFF